MKSVHSRRVSFLDNFLKEEGKENEFVRRAYALQKSILRDRIIGGEMYRDYGREQCLEGLFDS